MCLARGGVGNEGGEWIRVLGLGLGFTNPVCLCLGCGGVGGVGWKWVGFRSWSGRWGGVMFV